MPRSAIQLLLLVAIVWCGGMRSASAQPAPVNLSGIVSDLQDAVFANAQLLFISSAGHKLATTAEDGKYRVQLQPEVYDVYVKVGVNIWAYKRSGIDLKKLGAATLNLYLTPECVSYGCARLGYDYDVFHLRCDPLDLVIAYEWSKRSKGTTTYGGAVLTYGPTTINADEIVRDERSGMMRARRGWIEEGSTRKSFTEIQVQTGGTSLSAPDRITRLKSGPYWRSLAKLNEYFDAR